MSKDSHRDAPAVVHLSTQFLESVRAHVVELQHVRILVGIDGLTNRIHDAVLQLLSLGLSLRQTHYNCHLVGSLDLPTWFLFDLGIFYW